MTCGHKVTIVNNKVSHTEFYLVGFPCFLFYLSQYTVAPLLPIHIVGVGASTFQLGFVMAIPLIVSVLLRIPFGIVADRVGHWKIVLFALSLDSLCLTFFAIAPNVLWLGASAVLYGLSMASFGSPAIVLAIASVPATRRSAAVGMYLSMIGIAMVIGPLLCSLLAGYLELRMILGIAASLAFAGLAFLMLVYLHKLIRYQKFQETEIIEKANLKVTSSLKKLFSSKTILVICIISALECVPMGLFDTSFPVFAKESIGLTPMFIGLLFTFRGLVNAPTRLLSGKIRDGADQKNVFMMAPLVFFIAFVVVAFSQNTFLLAVSMGLYGLAWGSRAVCGTTLTNDNSPPQVKDLIMSLFFMMIDVGTCLGSILSGIGVPVIGFQNMLIFLTPVFPLATVMSYLLIE